MVSRTRLNFFENLLSSTPALTTLASDAPASLTIKAKHTKYDEIRQKHQALGTQADALCLDIAKQLKHARLGEPCENIGPARLSELRTGTG